MKARGSLLLLSAMFGCAEPRPELSSLPPPVNPMPESDLLWTPQPHRERPRFACVSPEGDEAWVMLAGTEDDPGTAVSVVDLVEGAVVRRIELGRSPWSCALHPGGRWLVVTLRYSNWAAVIDTRTDEIAARVPVPYYTETAIWHPAGKRIFLANRWKDSILTWDVEAGARFEVSSTSYGGAFPEDAMGTPVGENPSALAISADGERLFAGAIAGSTIAVLDTATGELVDADGDPTTTTRGAPRGISHLDFRSPVGGLLVVGNYLYVTDVGRGQGQFAHEGVDLDDDGQPGDGTANVVFQDLQNEIGVVDTHTLEELHRYTSDSICCRDFRDVDPDRPERGLLLGPPDTWQPDVVEALPPRDTWIVAGSLPEMMAASDGTLWVAYAGSNEVQAFEIDAGSGALETSDPPTMLHTGLNPKAVVVAGSRLLTVDRLSESISLFDPTRGTEPVSTVVVGDVSAGPFPATDAEIGEAINEMTAAFNIDGDQTCVHCHRDNGAIARPVIMPLAAKRAWSARNVMAQRGLFDTRPWFFESAMNQDNFFPVLNEFARKENFCCELVDPTVWSHYPTLAECADDPSLEGCRHVTNCLEDPPPECAERPYAEGVALRRSEFIQQAARKLLGRDTLVGDVLSVDMPDGTKQPRPLDFDGITRAVGLFMLRTSRLLPNPNAALHLPSARRGQVLFQETSVGCQTCHPLPATTNATEPIEFAPFGTPMRFPPVISPERTPDGENAGRVNDGFLATFPETVQTEGGLHLGATPLRGLWDRPQTRLYHDGRARSLLEALATPGHPILVEGQNGHNERDGVFDSHGGTSHLTRWELEDLRFFLLTL